MSGAVLTGPAWAEAVAVLANMTAAALGGCGERRTQDRKRAPGPDGVDLPASVVDGAGARANRVPDAPVRPGRGGGARGLGRGGRGGERHRSGGLRPVGGGPGRGRAPRGAGPPGRGR